MGDDEAIPLQTTLTLHKSHRLQLVIDSLQLTAGEVRDYAAHTARLLRVTVRTECLLTALTVTDTVVAAVPATARTLGPGVSVAQLALRGGRRHVRCRWGVVESFVFYGSTRPSPPCLDPFQLFRPGVASLLDRKYRGFLSTM